MAPAGKPEVSVRTVQKDSAVIMLTLEHFLLIRFVRAPNFSHAHHKCPLLLGSLEAAVTKFGGGVDELELDGLLGLAGCVDEQRLWGGRGKTQRCTRSLRFCLKE